MAKSLAARKLNQLLDEEDGDTSIQAFQEKHATLFAEMEKDGINATSFWMRITSNRDVESGK